MTRVNANIEGAAYEALKELAKSKGKTMTEILRDALTLEKFVADLFKNGGKLLVEEGGQIKELLVR